MLAAQAIRSTRTVARKPVTIFVDGRPVAACEGETLAAALLAAGYREFRKAPVSGEARGVFCMMGICQECVVVVDGARRNACLEPTRDGCRVSLDR